MQEGEREAHGQNPRPLSHRPAGRLARTGSTVTIGTKPREQPFRLELELRCPLCWGWAMGTHLDPGRGELYHPQALAQPGQRLRDVGLCRPQGESEEPQERWVPNPGTCRHPRVGAAATGPSRPAETPHPTAAEKEEPVCPIPGTSPLLWFCTPTPSAGEGKGPSQGCTQGRISYPGPTWLGTQKAFDR